MPCQVARSCVNPILHRSTTSPNAGSPASASLGPPCGPEVALHARARFGRTHHPASAASSRAIERSTRFSPNLSGAAWNIDAL